jgi:MoaA/NifB/PqqE/SkfB family radical SAM enzyme
MGEGGVSVLYLDGAEPMTCQDINLYLDTISHLKNAEEAPEYLFERVSIATNGFLVTQERSELLYEKGLRNIMVSIDGSNAQTHDQFRNPGSFEKAVSAIEILRNIGYDVRIGTTIWRGNVNQLENIAKLGIDLGVSEVAFNWMQPVGNALNFPDLLIADQNYQAVCDQINSVNESLGPYIKIGYHRGGIADPDKICRGGEGIVYIAGKYVWPCSWISIVSPEIFKSEMTLWENSLSDILENDPSIRRFRALVDRMSAEGAACPAMCRIYNHSFDLPDPISFGGKHLEDQKKI